MQIAHVINSLAAGKLKEQIIYTGFQAHVQIQKPDSQKGIPILRDYGSHSGTISFAAESVHCNQVLLYELWEKSGALINIYVCNESATLQKTNPKKFQTIIDWR